MTDIQLYTKLSSLPSNLKSEVSDFIDFLKLRLKSKHTYQKNISRNPGRAKGLIEMKDNSDDPIEGFNEYMR